MDALNNLFFIALPYVALAIFIIGSTYRYKNNGFQFSSLSSQFLEGRKLFWGTIPFHWGVSFLFVGHLIAFLFPREVLLWNSQPVRLIIIEVSAFIFGISMLVGLVNLIIRRYTNPRLTIVMNRMDAVVYALLLLQTISGLWIAYNFRWGTSWFSTLLTPYLYSIFYLQPEIAAVSVLPFMVKLHIIGAFVIIGVIPFSRLVHFLVPPINYLWRPYQQVRWYWERTRIRLPRFGWTVHRPKNN